MARKNIFELLEESYDLYSDTQRLLRYFENEKVMELKKEYSTLRQAANLVFSDWKARGRCIDLEDFLTNIDFDELCENAGDDLYAFLSVVEIVCNMWFLVDHVYFVPESPFKRLKCFDDIRLYAEECLSQYNYEIRYFEEQEKAIVVEAKSEVTAVAEIVEPDLALEVIRYNHHSLKGDVNAKRSILNHLGSEMEPRRKELKAVNSTLEDQIFFMLNNMNIRHNNIKTGDGNYREAVAQMPETELEQWYDELYQMILLAMLQMDNVDRTAKVKMLKDKITAK